MYPPGSDTVLVRFSGEVGVKSRSLQRRMEVGVRENLDTMLSRQGLEATIEYEHTRLYIRTEPEELDAVTEIASSVFGVTSVSPVVRVDPTLESLCEVLEDTAQQQYTGGTFAVRARRAGQKDAHPFSSTDIEREGGKAVFEALEESGIQPEVDLDDPDITYGVECRPEAAFVYLETRAGPGGLPLGTQEPLVVLVSGGIDSPVAAWEVMKRGCPIIPVYVDLGRFGGVDHRARAEQTVSRLTRYTPDGLAMWVVPGGEGLERIVDATTRYRMLLTRRFMLSIAAQVASETDAVGVVTGESIGQKSSQTSSALAVTGAVTDYPVHRPLVSMDKSQITERARAIGTYEESTIDAGCNRLAPENPATQPPLEQVRAVEPADIPAIVDSAVERRTLVELEYR